MVRSFDDDDDDDVSPSSSMLSWMLHSMLEVLLMLGDSALNISVGHTQMHAMVKCCMTNVWSGKVCRVEVSVEAPTKPSTTATHLTAN
jgi:hypothetical protein